MKKYVITLIICSLIYLTGYSQDCAACAVDSAYSFKKEYNEAKAFDFFNKAYSLDSNNVEACWNLSYYHALMGRRLKDGSKEQKVHFDIARSMAEKSFKIDSNYSRSNYAMSLAMGIVALISGPTEKIAASKAIKRYSERAIELEPEYAKPWYILGRWHHAVENLNFLEVLAADLLFGGAPEGSSMEEAVRCLENAVKYEPTSILYHYSLAAAHAEMDNEAKAKEILKKAIQMEALETDSEHNKGLCRKLLEDIN